jgi:flagellar basal-body rod protein FlgF
MGSGKYGALSGVISRMQMLDNISSNLSNVNTAGYKKGVAVFESQLSEAVATRGKQATNFTQINRETIDFSQGNLNKSGNPLHLAISGTGFFRVQQADGALVYTRRGNFQLNKDGEMVTSSGAKLLDDGDSPLTIPPGDVSFTPEGTIRVVNQLDNQLVGTVPLYEFADTNVLKRGNDGVFVAPADAVVTKSLQPEMLQGYLEGSNVNIMQETARMVYNTRVFEAGQKVLTSYSTMDSKLADLGGLQ